MSTSAEAELNALRQLFAQQSQELQKERATSARLRLENEALRASRAAAAPPDYAEAKTPDGANPAPAAFAIGPPPPRRRTSLRLSSADRFTPYRSGKVRYHVFLENDAEASSAASEVYEGRRASSGPTRMARET